MSADRGESAFSLLNCISVYSTDLLLTVTALEVRTLLKNNNVCNFALQL